MVMLLGSGLIAVPYEDLMDEYQVKAAFLYNFARFVEWPFESFQRSNEPLTICVLGIDPFGSSLDDTVAGRAIEGRSLAVRRISSIRQIAGCHVLFVSSAESKRSPPALAEIRTPGVLTVGDSGAPEMDGLIINFRLEGGKVRFAINLEAADRGRLRISSRLLSLARPADPDRKH